jgi:acetyltransferase-like isoleucine patch superfamily enzyme
LDCCWTFDVLAVTGDRRRWVLGHKMYGFSQHVSSLARKIGNAAGLLNAQWRLLGKARVPLSMRLHGRLYAQGSGTLVFGESVSIVGTIVPVELGTYERGRIEIGERTFINYGTSITAHESVKIGAHCFIGHYTFIMDNDQHDVVTHWVLPPSAPVVIEDNVWIGSKVVILPGVRIGHSSAIGAGSIVTSDIPPRCVAAGNPARVLRHLTEVA